jgi:hypothetical protein
MRRKQKISLLMSCVLGLFVACSAAEHEKKQNVESWIHLHPNRLKARFKGYKEFGKRSKAAGYTTIMIRFTNRLGYDKKSARDLIKYYKNDLGLKVIPEFKLLGKSDKTFGAKFLKKHPMLFEGGIVDPYAKYKGKPAFDSLIIPMIDEHIEIFDNPEYFTLGWDEYNNQEIKKIADRNNKSVSEVWAGTLNRVTHYLLSKNITPVIFGDQLMSKQLAEENNSVGYPADKRFKNFSAIYGVFPLQSNIDLVDSVKKIKNKDKIVILDWHYENEKEYPSVDYFQWLGFQEVIPVTWGQDGNMKYFSKYAKDRGLKKMMATVWHYPFNSRVRHLLWPTVDNSIVYFNNPDMEIPKKPKIGVLKDGVPILSAKPGETIMLNMSPAGKNAEFDVYPSYKMLRGSVITLKSDKTEVEWKIPENAKEGLWTIQGYSSRKDGYLLHGMLEGGLYISKKQLTLERKQDSFISIDFSKCERLGKKKQYILLNGMSKTNFATVEGEASIINGVLECKKGGVIVGRSNSDADSMSRNKTVMIEFMLNKFPGKKQEWAGILTWGCYGAGFRIIIWNKKLYVQIFGDERHNTRLISKKDIELGKKYIAVFNMNSKKATFYLNGVEQEKTSVASFFNSIPLTEPLSIGCSYKNSNTYNCFDGSIYRFAVAGGAEGEFWNSKRGNLEK